MVLRMPPARTSPDSCPGVLAVHQAADGGLARIRVPGGFVSADQLQVLASAAIAVGDGRLELTSRANLQIRGLKPGSEQTLSDRLYTAGLLPSMTHERVRNILASPLTGLDSTSLYDVRPLVAQLDRLLCARADLAELPGRFLFALDDGRGDLTALKADAGLQVFPDGRIALRLAGADTGVRANLSQGTGLLLATARAFLAERAEQRSEAWRLAELEDGVQRVLVRLNHQTAQDPSEASAPQGGPTEAGRHLQPDGRVALVVVVPLGSLTSDQAEAIGQAVRVTPWRSLVLPDIPADQVHAAEERLAGVGLVVDPESPWVGTTACAGQPGCAKALADVRADARRTTLRLSGRGRPVHWSGCERRCGHPADELVDVVATSEGYLVDGVPAGREQVGELIAARRNNEKTMRTL
ncbi:precorrin-3B synthase [Kribbella deserti]|uniref:Precorrin-3B synthase n=1 Tax=Kribbella deserti TaxID=1926257 RepID=A0ABV6QRE1_9ACTN